MHKWIPRIRKIEKLVNTKLQIKFSEVKVKLKLFDPVSPTQHLSFFHDTGSVVISEGFKLPSISGMYGAGIYVATDSSKSQQYSDRAVTSV